MSLLERISSFTRPREPVRRQPPPRIAADIGWYLPAWVMRVAVFLFTIALGGTVITAAGQWVLFVIAGLAMAWISEAAMGLVAVFLMAGFHLMGPGIAPGWRAGVVIALVHLIVMFTQLFNELPAHTQVQLQVLRKPLASWAAIQAGIQVVAWIAWQLQSNITPGPWLPLIAILSLGAVVAGGLLWIRTR